LSAPPIRAIVGWNGHLRWRSRNGEPFASVSLPRFPHPPAAKGFHSWLPREENRLHVPHVDPPERGGRRGTWNEEEGPRAIRRTIGRRVRHRCGVNDSVMRSSRTPRRPKDRRTPNLVSGVRTSWTGARAEVRARCGCATRPADLFLVCCHEARSTPGPEEAHRDPNHPEEFDETLSRGRTLDLRRPSA
jgi:hypothetical protein